MGRLAAIGIDSAEWAELQRLVARGRMPNLARLQDRSVEIPLVNSVVGRPEEAWTSFLYGTAPNRAGHWSALTFDPATYRSFRQGAFPGSPFFEGVAQRPLTFDVPKQRLGGGGRGTSVLGWGAHAPGTPRSSVPHGTLSEIDRRFGPHPGMGNDFQNAWFQPDYLDGLCDRLVSGARTRADATRWLLDAQPDWDLFLTVLSEAHSAGHHLWHGVDPAHPLQASPTAGLAARRMADVHAAVDEALGLIVQALPPDATVVVFSLHGMQPNDSDIASFLLLPELLHRLDGRAPRLTGPDHRSWIARGCPPVLPDPRRRPLAFARDHLADQAPSRLRSRVARSPLLDVERALRRMARRPPGHRRRWTTAADVPPEPAADGREAADLLEAATDFPNLWYDAAWPTMRAFSLPSFGEGRVRLNLAGRERDGVVALEDYATTCAAIERAVRETIDPRSGCSVVDDVVWTRRHDPLDPQAPDADLLITWRPWVDAFAHPELGTIGPMPFMRTGEHSDNGFALVSGPGLERRALDPRPASALPHAMCALLRSDDPTSPVATDAGFRVGV